MTSELPRNPYVVKVYFFNAKMDTCCNRNISEDIKCKRVRRTECYFCNLHLNAVTNVYKGGEKNKSEI